MIRYFIGKSGTGKTHTVYEEIGKLCEKKMGSKGFLIVPDQTALLAEQALAEKGGFAGVSVTNFRRLIGQTLLETGMPEGEKVDEVGQAVLVKKAFLACQKELEVFSKVHERAGFLSLFVDFITELRQSGVSPEQLIANEEGLSPTTVAKLRDSAKIYDYYLRASKGHFYTDEDLYELMAEAVEKSNRLKGAHLWIDGFYYFNALQQKMILALAKQAASVTISLTFNPLDAKQQDVFWAPYDAFETLRRKAEEAQIPEKKRHFETEMTAKSPALKHLADYLFDYPGQVMRGGEGASESGIQIVQCESPLQEVAYTAGRIRQLVLEGGVSYSEIAIVHHNGEVYEPVIKRFMKQSDIPVFIDERRQLTHSPLVTYMKAILQFFALNWKTEELMRGLKSGMLSLPKSDIDLLEKYSMEKGIKGAKWKKEASDPVVEAIRSELVSRLMAFEESLKACQTVSDYTTALWKHLEDERFGIKAHYEALLVDLSSHGDKDGINELVQSWKGVVSVFEQLQTVNPDETMTLKTYNELLGTAFSLKEVGVLPPNPDRVIVGSLDRALLNHIPYVFFLGFNDGWIPKIQDGSGILSDDEKVKLQQKKLNIKSDGELKARNELFLLYQTLTKATRKLTISHSLSDNNGKALRPSMFVDRLKHILPEAEVTLMNAERLQRSLSDTHANMLLSYTAEGLRKMVAGYPEEPYWLSRFDYLAKTPEHREKALLMAKSLFHENQPKPLSRKVAKKLYGTDIRASVTRLEAFNACPFSHFVRFGLRPKKQRDFELTLPDMGNLFHQSVEQFAIEALLKDPQKGRDLGEKEIDQLMDRIVDHSVLKPDYDIFRADARSAYMVNKLKRTGKRAAKLMLEHLRQGVFEPRAFEVAFGVEAEGIPPICIELATGEKIYLEGRIDRVDVYDSGQHQYIKIIDYKSGSKKYHLGDVYSGLQIQLMVYMDAVLKSAKAFRLDDPLYPAGVFYFKIDDPMVEGEQLSYEEIEQAIKKQLKMDGLVVGDRYVAAFMDEALLEDGSKSEIIPFDVKKEGEPGRYASYLSMPHFEALLTHVRQGIVQVCEAMVEGQVDVSPYRCGKEIACERCDYKGLCQFDLSLKNNQYRNINRLEREALVEKLEEEVKRHGEVDA